MKITSLVYLLMPIAIILNFLWAPSAEILGNTSRILYFHVPAAVVSVIGFVVAGVYSIRCLATGREEFSLKARSAVGLGLAFTVITTVTGSVWAKAAWGTYWNWDPRETSIIVLLLIYVAYFSLYAALGESEARAKISSAYLIFSMAVMPFFVFVVPRVYQSLHPNTIINAQGTVMLDTDMRIALAVSAVAFIFLYCRLTVLQHRLIKLEAKLSELGEE